MVSLSRSSSSDGNSNSVASVTPEDGVSPISPHQEKVSQGGQATTCSANEAALHLVKQYIGVGYLALPWAFARAGFLPGLFLILTQAVTVELGARLLVACAEAMRMEGLVVRTYEDIAGHVFGRSGVAISSAMVLIVQVGGGMAYFVFIAKELVRVTSTLNVELWMLILSPLVGAMALIPSYKQLAMLSTAGALLLTVVFLALVGYASSLIASSGQKIQVVGNAAGAFDFLGVTFFALSPTFSVIPIQAQMTKRQQFPRVFSLTLVLVTILYAIFGAVGYAAFGTQSESIITFNLSLTPAATALIICTALNVLLSFPVGLFPANLALDTFFFEQETPPLWAFVTIRLSVVVICLVMALLLPHFGSILSIFGALGAGVIGAACPAVFFWHLHSSGTLAGTKLQRSRWGAMPIKMLVVLYGVVGMVIALIVVGSVAISK